MKLFGIKVKQLRQQLGYSQKKVSLETGINIDTIRKIENGYVIPKFETLEHLSSLYKYDTLKLFSDSRESHVLFEIYNDFDYLVTKYSESVTKEFVSKIEKKIIGISPDLIDSREIEQLLLLMKCVETFDRGEFTKDLFDKLCYCIKLTNSEFDISSYSLSSYSQIEMHCLFLIAVLEFENENYLKSIMILHFMLDYASKSPVIMIRLELKMYYMLSYCYHMIDQYWNSLINAEKGIYISLKNDCIYGLENHIARKGIALYHLGNAQYTTYLKQSLSLIKIKGNEKNYRLFESIFCNKYDFIAGV